MKVRGLLLAGVVALVVVLVSGPIFSGCAKPPPPAPPEEEVVPAPPEEEVIAPPEEEEVVAPAPPPKEEVAPDKYGGVLKIILPGGPPVLGDPAKMIPGPWTGQLVPCIEGLVRVDKMGRPTPLLAEAWEWAPDGKSVTLSLRKGVKFHDGTDFNAEAVKWNLDRVIAGGRAATEKGPPPGAKPPGPPPGEKPAGEKPPGPPPVGLSALSTLDSVDVIDDYTIRLNVSVFDNSFLNYLAIDQGTMVSPTAVETNGEDWARFNPVGTGPFKFVEYKHNVSLEYERFDDYWQEGKPYLDGLKFIYIREAMVASASFQAGEAHVWLGGVSPKDTQELKQKGYKAFFIVQGGFTGLAGDSANPDSVYADKRVREAIEYAIDRPAIAAAVGYGYWEPLQAQICTPASFGYNPDYEGRPYNPDKARQLLAEAGYPNGFETTIFLMPLDVDTYTAVQAQLSEVGIDAELDVCDRGRYMDKAMNGWQNGLLWVAVGANPNHTGILAQWLAETSIFWPSTRRPAGLQALIDQAVATRDYDTQIALTQQAVKMIAEEAMLLPVFGDSSRCVTHESVHDTGFCETYHLLWTPENAWLSQ